GLCVQNCRRYLAENASSTLPGSPFQSAYPELVSSRPSATTGPAESIDPPFAVTWFTVSNSRTVLKSQMMLPSVVEYARMWPSTDPENTTPGITETGADCAPVQPRPLLHSSFGAGVLQIFSPVASFSAKRPPASFGAARTSDTGMYAACSSAADPHSMPPSAPPLPALNCHTVLPSLSGSIPHT